MSSLIVAIWGKEKSGKSTVSLSFPKPIVHFDIDVGGFARASRRLSDLKGITSKPYPVPLQIDKLMGSTTEEVNNRITVRIPKKVVGMRELWQSIIQDYVDACQDKDVKTIVMDSATGLWSICHQSYLQEKQEMQMQQGVKDTDREFREQLTSIEYVKPNDRMKSLIYTSRSFGKNLVLTHYPRDVYRDKLDMDGRVKSYTTGEEELDGFKYTTALVDLVVRTFSESSPGKPTRMFGRVTLSGLGKELEGMEFNDITHAQLMSAVEMINKKGG